MSIDSENYFWGKIKSNISDFANIIDRNNCNKWRRNLIAYHNKLTSIISDILNEGEDVFIIGSVPLPVCNIARASRIQVLSENIDL